MQKVEFEKGNVLRIQTEQKIALGTLWFSGWLIVAVLIFIIGYIFYFGLPTALSFLNSTFISYCALLTP